MQRMPPVRILIVVDGHEDQFTNITFSPGYFSLSAAIARLRTATWSPVRFEIETAHRQTDTHWDQQPETKPDYENFCFDQDGFDLGRFDQVWLFGMRGEGDRPLRDEEIAILARWMDAGGGVFAAGDHEDLGAALCSGVPRVRRMRRWLCDETPPVSGENRHDTLDRGHDEYYTFDDESDDVPQRIELAFPVHPLLAYGESFIDILPDHPHEGEVVPDDDIPLDGFVAVGDYGAREFPGSERPRTIAWGTVNSDHSRCSDRNKGAARGRRFGVLGAYDGHAEGVGRVVVDSTWHHWFDVNLVGRPVELLDSPPRDETNPKTKGFLATSEGRLHLDRIYTLFLNVATWLIRAEMQHDVLAAAVAKASARPPVVELVEAKVPERELGEAVRRTLGRSHGRVLVEDWLQRHAADWLGADVDPRGRDEAIDMWLGCLARGSGAEHELAEARGRVQLEATRLLRRAWEAEQERLQTLGRRLDRTDEGVPR